MIFIYGEQRKRRVIKKSQRQMYLKALRSFTKVLQKRQRARMMQVKGLVKMLNLQAKKRKKLKKMKSIYQKKRKLQKGLINKKEQRKMNNSTMRSKAVEVTNLKISLLILMADQNGKI
jgi:predicted RND superfamily exporter protein